MRKYPSDVYRAVAKRTGTTPDEVRRILANEQDVITEMLAKGHSVTLIGFGTFYTRVRPSGTAFGHEYPERTQADFRAGAELRREVAE